LGGSWQGSTPVLGKTIFFRLPENWAEKIALPRQPHTNQALANLLGAWAKRLFKKGIFFQRAWGKKRAEKKLGAKKGKIGEKGQKKEQSFFGSFGGRKKTEDLAENCFAPTKLPQCHLCGYYKGIKIAPMLVYVGLCSRLP
jgi:hypothetical protein